MKGSARSNFPKEKLQPTVKTIDLGKIKQAPIRKRQRYLCPICKNCVEVGQAYYDGREKFHVKCIQMLEVVN